MISEVWSTGVVCVVWWLDSEVWMVLVIWWSAVVVCWLYVHSFILFTMHGHTMHCHTMHCHTNIKQKLCFAKF
jgi:hypothetical protein